MRRRPRYVVFFRADVEITYRQVTDVKGESDDDAQSRPGETTRDEIRDGDGDRGMKRVASEIEDAEKRASDGEVEMATK